eukprot:342708-Rhodomonas_salina.1
MTSGISENRASETLMISESVPGYPGRSELEGTERSLQVRRSRYNMGSQHHNPDSNLATTGRYCDVRDQQELQVLEGRQVPPGTRVHAEGTGSSRNS